MQKLRPSSVVVFLFLAAIAAANGRDYQKTVFGLAEGTWKGSGTGASSPAGNTTSFFAERTTVIKGRGASRRWVTTIISDYGDRSSSGEIWTTRRLKNGTYHQASQVIRKSKVERWWQPNGKFREETWINGRIGARSSGTWKMSGKKFQQRETLSFGGRKFTRQTSYVFPSSNSMTVTIKGAGVNSKGSYRKVR